MSSMSYPAVGNVSRLSVSFLATDGVTPADPTTVSLVVKAPGQGEQNLLPVRDGTGLYHYDLTLAAPGDYYYRFIGTGAVVAQTADGHFNVPGESF